MGSFSILSAPHIVLISIWFVMIVLTIFAPDVCCFNLIHQNELPVLPVIQLHGTPAVTAVPQAVVMSAAVRRS